MRHHCAVASQPKAAKFQASIKAISGLVQDNGHRPTVASPREAVQTSVCRFPTGGTVELGQPVVVLNKPGAAASVAAHAVNASSADGYTLGLDMPRLFWRKLFWRKSA